jgi:hypothetical protein
MMRINPSSFDDIPKRKSIALHETMHGIQDIEGLSPGGAPESLVAPGVWRMTNEDFVRWGDEVHNKQRVLEYYEKAKAKGITPLQALEEESRQWGFDTGNPRIRELLEADLGVDRARELYLTERAKYDKYRQDVIFDPFKKYKRLAGEVEARAVQSRADMPPGLLRERPFWMDWEFPESEQIVR